MKANDAKMTIDLGEVVRAHPGAKLLGMEPPPEPKQTLEELRDRTARIADGILYQLRLDCGFELDAAEWEWLIALLEAVVREAGKSE